MLQNFLRTTELYWKSEIKCPVFGAMKKGFWSFPKVSFAKEMKVIVERRLLFFVALLEARWEFRRLSWLYHPFLWLISVEGGGVGPLLRLACFLLQCVYNISDDKSKQLLRYIEKRARGTFCTLLVYSIRFINDRNHRMKTSLANTAWSVSLQ